ncbi:LysR family transcriptional regulator substrate-binding protein [Streptomyces sp. B-S-A8]|uniref:LysR family transcriptional regulator substrate-binding protein n=1 Tax=Streptomyces solicavernae TaxID=3043614 RepID=A0ABT6RL17_9ACTN|nr:LysR family transcriptional regulator substrate-binding protein [Streptomyces sp. B-S-A8]MDI3384954.1 LysR family transcriptional regulator substrate-binding protein [Streptomyces sp. B-S-A8]
MTGSETPPSFRLAYVPGATPAKWVRIWNERLPDVPLNLVAVPAAEAAGLLRDGDADAGLVRLPVDRDYFSAIPLYTETSVVVIPKDHLAAAFDEVTADDIADEIVLHPLDDPFDWEKPPGQPAFERPATTADAVELVAAGIGLLVVPQSLARLHHRRDLTYRTITGVPQSQVALAWPEERTTDLVDDFIGIVRGRTVNSTRGRRGGQEEGRAEKKGAASPGKSSSSRTGKPGGKTPRAGGKSGGSRAGGAKAGGAKAGGSPRTGSGAKRGKPRRRS